MSSQRFKKVLDQRVVKFTEKLNKVTELLTGLEPSLVRVVHGDICPENILVKAGTVEPMAIVDFGFLSMNGDPIFDAVIASQILSMYDDYSVTIRESFASRMAEQLGGTFHSRYELYRAAYAFITSNAYSATGDDGHFSWCVDILNSEGVEDWLLDSR